MRKSIFICVISILLLFLFTGCSSTPSDSSSNSTPTTTISSDASMTPLVSTALPTKGNDSHPTQSAQPEDALMARLEQMSLREKVGQLFIIRPEALILPQESSTSINAKTGGVTQLSDALADVLKEYPAGGIAMFGKNIVNAKQITAFNRALQDASSIPLFISIDEEGGLVARLANHDAFDLPKYKSAAAVGKRKSSKAALTMGETIGAYLRKYGFNLDFAPVADINSNPKNKVIGTRAFSSDAAIVEKMAAAMAKGLKRQHIIPTFKHFPGHGDTAEDSHIGIAVSHKSKREMEHCEWLPYQSLTKNDCVMVGHIATPKITGTLVPASLSPEIVQDILRQQLGFEGVVITDALEMGAITKDYTSAEAAIAAIDAGCDILLIPQDYREAFAALMHAVKTGTISEDRIDESVYRILQLKEAYGILD